LNFNKTNYFIENDVLKKTVQNQKLIIAKLEKDVQTKIMTIDYLTQQISQQKQESAELNHCKAVTNLLEFD
jgi:hypothetical protein